MVGDRLSPGGAEDNQPGQGVLLGVAAAFQRRLRMFQGHIVGLYRPKEISFTIDDHVAVSDGAQQAAEAARPDEADKEVVLAFVEAANNRRELRAVHLELSADLFVQRADGSDAAIELGDLLLAVEDLLAERDQAQFRLVQGLLE